MIMITSVTRAHLYEAGVKNQIYYCLGLKGELSIFEVRNIIVKVPTSKKPIHITQNYVWYHSDHHLPILNLITKYVLSVLLIK